MTYPELYPYFGRINQIKRLPQKTLLLLCLAFSFMMKANAQQPDKFDKQYSDAYESEMVERMKTGIDKFLTRHTTRILSEREQYWDRDLSSVTAYQASIDPNREELSRLLGIHGILRNRPDLKVLSTPDRSNAIAETPGCNIYQVEWQVHQGLVAEGLLLVPKGKIRASVVVVPDADEIPESYSGLAKGNGLALQLAESGAIVLVPALVDRGTEYSGSDELTPSRPWMSDSESAPEWTNQTHREWIHRQGYLLGKHIIGLEILKILSVIDYFEDMHPQNKVGVMGYGEGGLLAFYTAALDKRVDAAWVSGYFGPRFEVWKEPVYRNVWGLLKQFGDAEIASLIVPGKLIIEQTPVPEVSEPRTPKAGQADFALPGTLVTPAPEEVEKELDRLKAFFPAASHIHPDVTLTPMVDKPGSKEAIEAFSAYMGIRKSGSRQNSRRLRINSDLPDNGRQYRVFHNMQQYLQDMIPAAERTRYAFLKGDTSSPEAWETSMKPLKDLFYSELVGRIDIPLLPSNPKLRLIYDEPGWKGYEVILDVWDDVFAWGILAVPKNIDSREKRPAVVVQHGIGGVPSTAIEAKSYKGVVQALANRGFVVFSPHNPYQFNVRKANAIKTSVYSMIIPQHRQILNFLQSLNYVDSDRIALYGKSWGGRSAQRIPIVLDDYKVAISSAYFNDWMCKSVSNQYRNSYFFEDSPGIYEWNMAHTFTHSEMALLICPRPFMVESGYLDGVAAHEMVAYEFAKVKRLYDLLGIGDRAELEFFWGGHDIHGKGTFSFLHKYLDWPEPEVPTKEQQVTQ